MPAVLTQVSASGLMLFITKEDNFNGWPQIFDLTTRYVLGQFFNVSRNARHVQPPASELHLVGPSPLHSALEGELYSLRCDWNGQILDCRSNITDGTK